MIKWYEADDADNGIVISSRVRLARNIKKYPFSAKISDGQAIEMIKSIKDGIMNQDKLDLSPLEYMDLQNLCQIQKASLVENHMISLDLFKKTQPCGIIYNQDESLAIMLNEEDHIRIQSILLGDNMDKVLELANKADNLLEGFLEYAYDGVYGYLTSCPTNVGTGMRASYMLHIPLIELTGQIRHIMQFISKFGMTVRGIYGEGSQSQGGIYQISNQVTLGQSEEEIVSNIKSVANNVILQEQKLRQKFIAESYTSLEDKVYRAYGVLNNARILDINEAMKNLSYIRLGYSTEILKLPKPLSNIHKMMMDIQPANLLKYSEQELTIEQTNIKRADFIRKQFLIS
jgi:protein arginine kinase